MLSTIKKFKKLLNRKQKQRVAIIFIMMVIGAFLETMSVSMILPLVSAIMDPSTLETDKYVRMVCRIFDLHSVNTFVILLITGLIFVFLLKNLFLFLEYYIQYRFVYNNRFTVQRRLIQAYLKRPYEYFLHASTGVIMRVVSADTTNAFNLLTTILNFFTEATVSVMLVVILIAIDPFIVFVFTLIMGVAMLVISKVIKPVLRNAGISFQINSAKSNKWLLQSVSGIKEIKVARKSGFFIEQYTKYGKKEIDAQKKNSILGNVPRLLIEAVSVSGILGVIAVLLLQGRELSTMIPQLSAFAMAAVRLMPSVNRLSTAYNSMSYQEPSLDQLLENLEIVNQWENETKEEAPARRPEKTQGKIKLTKSIKLSHITFTYPNSSEKIFEDASMEIPVGKSVGIVGTSGAGKTTAVDILLGLLEPSSGQVLSDGVDIKTDCNEWLSHIGYIPQMIFMLDDTIKANVAFGFSGQEVSEERVWKVLSEAKLDDFVRNLPDGLNTEIGERGVRLSGGQRQRIGIARALYTNPELLIFDEATSALDNETEAAIMDSVNSLHGKKTMVIIAHRLGTIENCDVVYRVKEGKIIKEDG